MSTNESTIESTTELEVVDSPGVEIVQLGSLALAPADVVARATEVATTLAEIVRKQKLYTKIAGKAYVRVEGWTTLGAILGVVPRELSVKEIAGVTENGAAFTGYEALVELVRTSDGAVIGRASAECSTDESRWSHNDRYARRSMSITRATSKAFRLSFSWIMALAGYEVTPAEEIPPGGFGNDAAQYDDRVEARSAARASQPANGKPSQPKAPAGSSSIVTEFWGRTKQLKIDRKTALDFVEAAGGDFAAALERLDRINETPDPDEALADSKKGGANDDDEIPF